MNQPEDIPVRKLKVYYRYNDTGRSLLPMIRLQGRYLSNSGFNIGDRLEVTLDTEQITIKKEVPPILKEREQEIKEIRERKEQEKTPELGR